MKKFFISVLRSIVIVIQRLIKTIKKQSLLIRTWLKSGVNSSDTNTVASKRIYVNSKEGGYNRSARKTKKPLWKNKRIIAGVCIMAVVVTVVLTLVLPKSENTAVASNDLTTLDAAAVNEVVKNAESPSGTVPPETSATAGGEAPDSQAGLSPSVSPADPAATGAAETGVSTTASIESLPEATPIPTTAPDKVDLVPGCNDPRILEVQTQLMELGYMGADEPTDFYGYGTEYALQLFQRKHSLQVDGLLGEQTLATLFSADVVPYTVKLGDRGSDVEEIQVQLQKLNYLKAGSSGYFGTDTEKAVKSFQSRNGLSSDGSVGENTLEMLYSEDAKPAKTSSGGGSSGGGSSGGGNESPAAAAPNEASANALVDFAQTQLGKRYVRAGKGPDVFDCSGFVYYCLNQSGYSIGYMTSAGWAKSGFPKVTKMADLMKGDIVCFKGHVGIYMGGGQMIDASSGAGQIRICSNIFNSSYWTRNFICGRRVF